MLMPFDNINKPTGIEEEKEKRRIRRRKKKSKPFPFCDLKEFNFDVFKGRV